MNLTLIFLAFLLLIFLDKGLTILNIQQTWKNLPDAVKDDPYKAEKNPVAHYLFTNFGLYYGSLMMVFVSILTLFIIYGVVKVFSFNFGIAVYIVMLIYGFVVTNNFYFLLKYSGVI